MTIRVSEDHNYVPESAKSAPTNSEVALRLLFESLRDYEILLLDPTGYVVSASSGIETIKGYRSPEVIGQHFSCFFSPSDVQLSKPEQVLEIAALTGRFEEDSWAVRKDGSQFWVNIAITRLLDEKGQLYGFSQVTQAITSAEQLEVNRKPSEASVEERLIQLQLINQQLEAEIAQQRQADAKIRESYSLLNEVIEGTSDIIFVKNQQGKYVLVNSAFTQIVGRSAEEIIGQDDLALFPKEPAHRVMMLDQSIISSGVPKTLEESIPFPEEIKTFLTTKTPYRDSQNNVIGLIGITRDISERKQIEDALRTSEQDLRTLFNGIHDAIFLYDLDGKILDVNEKMLQMYGVTREQAANFSLSADYSSSENPLFQLVDRWKRVVAGEIQHFEWIARRPNDGSHFDAEVILQKVTLSDKAVILANIRDITQRKQTEAALQEAMSKLELRVEARTRELQDAIAQLESEAAERKQAEAALASSEARFRDIAANMPGAIFQFSNRNEVWTVDYVSQGIWDISGVTAEDMMQNLGSFIARLHPDDLNSYITTTTEAVENLTPWHYEGRLIKPNGEIVWWQGDSTPTQTKSGKIVFCGVLLDITDRKQAEKRLKQAKVELATKVEERTAELKQVIEQLEHENAERRQVEEALRQEQEFTNVVVENVSEGVVACDADGKLKLFNRASREWHGCDPRAVPPEEWANLYDLYGPDGVTPLPTEEIPLLRAFHGESVREAGMAIVAKGKTPRYILATGAPLFDATGYKIGAVVVMHDITERKQVEEVIRQSEERYRSLTIATSQIVWTTDSEGQVVDMPPWRAHTGQSVEEVKGWGWLDALHPNDRERTAQVWGHAVETKSLYATEYRIRSADGSYRYFSVRGVPVLAEDGNIREWVGTCTDINDRHQAEEALRQSEAQLREKAQREQLLNYLASQIRSSLDLNQILETAVQAIRDLLQVDRCMFIWYQTDAEAAYWEVVQEAKNPDLPGFVGFQAASAEILPIAEKSLNKEFIWIDDVQAVPDPVTRQFFLSMGYTAALSLPIHTQSGEIGVVNCVSVTGVRLWENNEVELLQAVANNLAIAIDQAKLYKQSRTATITAQMQAQQLEETLQELKQTQAKMLQSEKMSSLGQLVAGVAHEINNPVNFIYGNLTHANHYTQDLLRLVQIYQQNYPNPVLEVQEEAEAIDLDFLVEDLPKLLSSMRVGADRIQQIVASLRNFSRMDEAEMKEVNIHEGIDSTLMILQNRLKAKHNQPAIEVIKHYGDLPLVECYAGQLNQVFMNIFSNAIDALEERDQQQTFPQTEQHPSHIRIYTERFGSNQVKIRIADNGPGMSSAVQQRLFDPFFTTKAVGKGTGMGMSISYQIVTEKHGGSLRCISTVGQGAEFVIEIPLRQQNYKNLAGS